MGASQRKTCILQLGKNDAILVQNMLLTQIVEELTKQLSKFPKQFKQMQETSSKPHHITFCELCTCDHPTGFCLQTVEEVNYIGNQQQRQAPYQGNKGYQCGNNAIYGQVWGQDTRPSNRQDPYKKLNQHPPQPPNQLRVSILEKSVDLEN